MNNFYDRPIDFLVPDSHGGYICPCCGSGSGPKGTGLSLDTSREDYVDHPRYKCFACGAYGDVIDWYAHHIEEKTGVAPQHPSEAYRAYVGHGAITTLFPTESLSVWNEERATNVIRDALRRAPSEGGLTYSVNEVALRDALLWQLANGQTVEAKEALGTYINTRSGDLPVSDTLLSLKNLLSSGADFTVVSVPKQTKVPVKTTQDDFTEYLALAAANLDPSYLESRGISEDIQREYGIGTDATWKHPKAPGAAPTNRCIIPVGTTGYLARAIDSAPTDKAKMKAGAIKGHLFNEAALETGFSTIFVTEGEIDAMSVAQGLKELYPEEYDDGLYSVIGLGSAGGWNTLADKAKVSNTFVLAMDNDDAGQKAQISLSQALKKKGISFIVASPLPEGSKDPNEALCTDKEAFLEWLKRNIPESKSSEESVEALKDFFLYPEKQPEYFQAPTGFSGLDKVLAGGLHEGVITIGALSSLGKTTFILQMADQIARAGQDVLYFSLEMSTAELVSKGISRASYDLVRSKVPKKANESDAVYSVRLAKEATGKVLTTANVLNARRLACDSDAYKEAVTHYFAQGANNLYIYEGLHNGKRLTVEDITNIVQDFIVKQKTNPVVFIDYLQIIYPGDDFRGTDKQAVDNSVFALKTLSREKKIPVVCVSSFNRENYFEPVSMVSFKESGAVEYSSDVLIGLQYAFMNDEVGEKSGDRRQRIRGETQKMNEKKKKKEDIDIECRILKNRNGYLDTIPFKFNAAFNWFAENQRKPKKERCVL